MAISPSEAETRAKLIDQALQKAEWKLEDPNQVGQEIPVDDFDPEEWHRLQKQIGRRIQQEKGKYVTLPVGISEVIMEIPNGKCSSCGRMIPIWRCGETTGGGTYHIVCSECSARESQRSPASTAVWRWIGWLLLTGFLIGTLFVGLVFGGY